MKQLENIIIYILILLVGYFYIKNNENFVVQYKPYYPITPRVNPKFNNYNNSIDDKRLVLLNKVLQKIKKESNNGSDEFKEFNKVNLPVIKKNLELNDIKPVTDFLLNKINNKLGESYTLITNKVIDIYQYQTEEEVKINFRLICEFKIKTNNTIIYTKQEYTDNSKENKLIIVVELLSKKNYDNESIYINYIQISGLTGGNYLPGKNYYDNNSHFLISDFNYNTIIENKKELNAKEVNNMNINIPEEEPVLNNITFDESNDESIINTEEAESFFNL